MHSTLHCYRMRYVLSKFIALNIHAHPCEDKRLEGSKLSIYMAEYAMRLVQAAAWKQDATMWFQLRLCSVIHAAQFNCVGKHFTNLPTCCTWAATFVFLCFFLLGFEYVCWRHSLTFLEIDISVFLLRVISEDWLQSHVCRLILALHEDLKGRKSLHDSVQRSQINLPALLKPPKLSDLPVILGLFHLYKDQREQNTSCGFTEFIYIVCLFACIRHVLHVCCLFSGVSRNVQLELSAVCYRDVVIYSQCVVTSLVFKTLNE